MMTKKIRQGQNRCKEHQRPNRCYQQWQRRQAKDKADVKILGGQRQIRRSSGKMTDNRKIQTKTRHVKSKNKSHSYEQCMTEQTQRHVKK